MKEDMSGLILLQVLEVQRAFRDQVIFQSTEIRYFEQIKRCGFADSDPAYDKMHFIIQKN